MVEAQLVVRVTGSKQKKLSSNAIRIHVTLKHSLIVLKGATNFYIITYYTRSKTPLIPIALECKTFKTKSMSMNKKLHIHNKRHDSLGSSYTPKADLKSWKRNFWIFLLLLHFKMMLLNSVATSPVSISQQISARMRCCECNPQKLIVLEEFGQTHNIVHVVLEPTNEVIQKHEECVIEQLIHVGIMQ